MFRMMDALWGDAMEYGRRDESRLYKVDGMGNNDVFINVYACRDADLSRLEEQNEYN